MNRLLRLSSASLALALLTVTAAPGPAGAFWRNLKLEAAFEQAYVAYGSLADFTNVVEPSLGEGLTVPEDWLFELEDETATGFRLAVRLHRDLEISWSHLISNTRYRISRDGVALRTDPEVTAISTSIPAVDTRFDMITLGMRISRLQTANIVPLVRLGVGWVLTSQQGPLRFTGLPVSLDEVVTSLDRDYSDSDVALEASVGAEWRWRFVSVGVEMRTVHWRWNTGLDFIPSRVVHSFLPMLRIGVAY
jgi:hypothetical protein